MFFGAKVSTYDQDNPNGEKTWKECVSYLGCFGYHIAHIAMADAYAIHNHEDYRAFNAFKIRKFI